MARSRRGAGWEPEHLAPLVIVVVLAILAAWLFERRQARRPAPAVPPGEYLFCCWNVENLFDDRDDPTFDDAIEDWFGRDPAALRAKHALLVDALLALNGGRGPDILALVEVENRRAVELLRDALNARLPPHIQYGSLVHRDNRTGRRIEPALLSRLGAIEDRTRDYGIRRILAAQIGPEHEPLIILVSHWTSRVTDRTGEKRSGYARLLYRGFLDWHRSDPDADLLIAGDFNDEPGDPSVATDLRATADRSRVRPEDARPRLWNLAADPSVAAAGTYLYRNRWEMLDQVVASPGMLGPPGWRVVPDSFEVVDTPRVRAGRDGRPRRFGGPGDRDARGPSDHFAVTVRLARVGPTAAVAAAAGPAPPVVRAAP